MVTGWDVIASLIESEAFRRLDVFEVVCVRMVGG
jgi:hypothetical protein